MRLNPRPYQREAIDRTRELFDLGLLFALIVMATGLGKTVFFAHLIKEILDECEPGDWALIIGHRNELLTQARDKYKKVDPDELVGIFQGSKRETWARVLCASIASCYGDKVADDGQVIRKGRRRDLKLEKLKIVVIDECHHAPAESYMDLIREIREKSPGCMFVGVTATPSRGDDKGLGDLWSCTLEDVRRQTKKARGATGALVFKMGIAEGIEGGYLVPLAPHSRRVVIAADLDGVKRSRTTHDFVESSLAKVVDTPEVREKIVEKWIELAGPGTPNAPPKGRPTAAFTVGVAGAKALAEDFCAAGVAAAAVWGEGGWIGVVGGVGREVPREEAVKALQTGAVTVLVNCQVLTEGWDESSVSCVLIGRPVSKEARGLFTQMAGRGLRLAGATYAESCANGKIDCLLLDFAGASEGGVAGQEDLRVPVVVEGIEEPPPKAVKDNAEELLLMALSPVIQRATIRGVTEYAVDIVGGRVSWPIINGARVCYATVGLGVIVYPHDDGTHSAVAVRDREYRVLADRTTEAEALGKATAFAVLHGDPSYLRPGPWFTAKPATPAQMDKLKTSIEANQLIDRRRAHLGTAHKPLDVSGLPPEPSMALAFVWLTYLHMRMAFGTSLAKQVEDLFSPEERADRLARVKGLQA